jgi:ribonuclease P/MRP protein subunit RPP1
MSYYESCVHALPEGSDSASRLALVARRLGYSGIIICNHTGYEKVFQPEAVQEVSGIKVAIGVEVMAPNSRSLRSRVAAARSKFPFVAVHGGSEEMNKAACENPEVDVLVHPEEGKKILSIAAAKAAQINQVAIGFDLSPLIRLRGAARSRWLQIMQRNIILARKFDLSLTITTCARSRLDLRAPRDLQALAEIAGLESFEVEEALKFPGRLLEKNSRKWAGPGVEIL